MRTSPGHESLSSRRSPRYPSTSVAICPMPCDSCHAVQETATIQARGHARWSRNTSRTWSKLEFASLKSHKLWFDRRIVTQPVVDLRSRHGMSRVSVIFLAVSPLRGAICRMGKRLLFWLSLDQGGDPCLMPSILSLDEPCDRVY